MDNDIFGIYDESFDIDHDGQLNASEYDYMMEELYEDKDEDEDEDDFDDFDEFDEDEDDWDEDEDDDWDEDDDEY